MSGTKPAGPRARRDLTGRTFGNWEIVRPIGEGAFGAVYEAAHRAIRGRKAALKILHPELAFKAESRRRFLNEASAASRAGHDNIVQVFDCGETDDGLCFVVMELLEGASVKERLRQGPMLPERAIDVARQVAAALAAVHGVGIVHRDLKPDNLFLVARDGGETLKVLDFGLAKVWDEEVHTRRA